MKYFFRRIQNIYCVKNYSQKNIVYIIILKVQFRGRRFLSEEHFYDSGSAGTVFSVGESPLGFFTLQNFYMHKNVI